MDSGRSVRLSRSLRRWLFALKPKSWGKLIVPMLLGQAVAVSAGGIHWSGLALAVAFTVFDLAYIVLLNDWADRAIDATKRRMFPEGCSPKTIPDGILPALHVLIAGLMSGVLALAVATFGGLWLDRPLLGLFAALALGLFAAYSLPPLRLNYRGGGEFLEMAGVGVVLPWLSAYAQCGQVVVQPLLPVALGFAPLAFSSAVASGIADEQSDRAGGKRTVVTQVGNVVARHIVEGSMVFGAVVWFLLGGPVGVEVALWLGAVLVVGLLVWGSPREFSRGDQRVLRAARLQGVVAPRDCRRGPWGRCRARSLRVGLVALASHATHRSLAVLADADDWLAQRVGVPASVAPGRAAATALVTLGRWAIDVRFAEVDRLAERLAELVRVQQDSFPENIFWDNDLLVSRVVHDANQSSDQGDYVDRVFDELLSLHRLYGRKTEIRFRYVHDFQYGFDWAKWVKKDPGDRHDVLPFSLPFLRAIRARGHELLALIAANDETYPQLDQGEPRNPFPFSREPNDERRLYRDLAEKALIPVEAWKIDGGLRLDPALRCAP